MNKKKHILILGGGLTGLSTAKSLSKEYKVTILEKKSYLGGLAASFKKGEYQIPFFYHHIIKHNSTTIKYLNEYGLLKNAEWKKIKVVIASDGDLCDISNPLDLLKFNAVSLWGRFRFGLFGLYMLFLANPDNIADDQDARSWLMKVGGKEVTNTIFNHLYARNKFNIDLTKISAKQLAWRLKEREAFDPFTYPEKGLHILVDNLEKDIVKNEGIIVKGSNVKKVILDKKIVITDKKEYKPDIVINTIPIPEFLKVASRISIKYKRKLKRIKYCPAACVIFGTKKFLNKKYYWINVLDERVHTIFQHSILCGKYPWKVNWVLRYGGSEQDLNLSDKKIEKEYLGVVKKYFPKSDIVWTKVLKTKYGEPVYDKDYSSYKPDYSTPIKDFYNAGIQVTFPKIRNMNSALESGEKVAKIVFNDFKVS